MIDSELAAGFGIALLAAIAYDSGYALQAFEARRAPIEQSMRPGLLVPPRAQADLARRRSGSRSWAGRSRSWP